MWQTGNENVIKGLFGGDDENMFVTYVSWRCGEAARICSAFASHPFVIFDF